MNGPNLLFLVAILVPLLAARWRVSLIGLAAQGLLLFLCSEGAALDAVDFLVVRGVLAPVLLFLAFQRPGTPARNDVVPPNLFAWMVVVGLVLVSFNFAEVNSGGSARVGVAAAALVLGFFVLATQNSVFSQIVGAMRIENAIALFELSDPDRHASLLVRSLHLIVVATAVVLYAWYLGAMTAEAVRARTEPVRARTEPTPPGVP